MDGLIDPMRKLFTIMLLALITDSALGSKLETLIMPGKLIQGHAKYETECTQCHARLRNITQTELCLDCHEEVAEDLNRSLGFHGRYPGLADKACSDCHTDHAGRGADIVRLNSETFDHQYTDFPLEGAHDRQRCGGCHEPDQLFRDTPSVCLDCHKEDEPHHGRLGEQCQDCHNSEHWSSVAFDHGITDFPLEGRHRKLTCHSCHAGERYEHTPTDCNLCHALNDVHRGRNGTQCDDCHSPSSWEESRFDHDQETEFPLRGDHRKTACEACHTAPLADKKPPTDCYGCHRSDDVHLGRNGRKCNDCHSERQWSKTRFDHARETDFPLRGQHREVTCTACHGGNLYTEELDSTCHNCHRADDVHKGQQGKQCERCHQETGWGDEIVFDHDLTRFPLIGLHATAPCEECHLSGRFQDSPRECHRCHESDDVHEQALGQDCALCHNPNGWALWDFDHDTQTEFALDGGHQGIACEACHLHATEGDLRVSSLCHSCHRRDDVHRGRFGHNCERCHDTESFRDVRIQ